jgi:hypothetical protein
LAISKVLFFLRLHYLSVLYRFCSNFFLRVSAEKEQLLRDHQKALDAQKTISRELKEQAMQAALQHSQELKDAKAAAEARLAEVVDDSANSTAVLRTELEEERKARKAAEHRIELLTTDHKEYDRLVMQIDALALSKILSCLFFRSQAYFGSVFVLFFLPGDCFPVS